MATKELPPRKKAKPATKSQRSRPLDKAAPAKHAVAKPAAPKTPEPKKPELSGESRSRSPQSCRRQETRDQGRRQGGRQTRSQAGEEAERNPRQSCQAGRKSRSAQARRQAGRGRQPPGDADQPLLDMSDVGVRKMITRAKQRGYVTYDELNKVLPSDKISSEQIEDTMSMLNEMGINVIESEEQEEGAEGEGGDGALAARPAASRRHDRPDGEETYDRTDDPVRMYLREMGSVELSSREGEIAIAKRIEAGRELMIGALVRKPADLRSAHRLARRIERRQSSAARHHRSGSDVWRRPRRPARHVPPPVCRRRAARQSARQWPSRRDRRTRARRDPETRAAEAATAAARAAVNADGEPIDPAKPPLPLTPEPMPTIRRRGQSAAVGDGSGAEAAGARNARPDRQPLQEARQAAGRQRRSRAGRRRTFHQPGTPLQEAAQRDRRSRQGPQAQQQPHRSACRSDVRHQPPSGVARRPLAAPCRSAWRGTRRFPEGAFRQRARSQLGAPRRPPVAAWAGRISSHDERDKIHALRDEIQTLAQEMRQSIVDYRRIVQTVQKGERESGVRRRRK